MPPPDLDFKRRPGGVDPRPSVLDLKFAGAEVTRWSELQIRRSTLETYTS
jgi:hypothetical protein